MIDWDGCPAIYRSSLQPYMDRKIPNPMLIVWAVLENDLFMSMYLLPEQQVPFFRAFIDWVLRNPEVVKRHLDIKQQTGGHNADYQTLKDSRFI